MSKNIEFLRKNVAGLESVIYNTNPTVEYNADEDIAVCMEALDYMAEAESAEATMAYSVSGLEAFDIVVSAATNEDGQVDFAGVESYSMEALMEKVKQTGYKGKAMANKIIDKIIGFYRTVVNHLVGRNLMLKKFKPMIKKYKKMLEKKTFKGDTEKNENYEVTKFDKLTAASTGILAIVAKADKSALKDASDVMKTDGKTLTQIIEQAFIGLEAMSVFKVTSIVNKDSSVEAIEDSVKENPWGDKATEFVSENAYDDKKENKGVLAARTYLMGVCDDVLALLDTNIDLKAKSMKFVSDLEKAKNKRLKTDDGKSENDEDITKANRLVSLAGQMITKIMGANAKAFSHAQTGLQKLITDIYKVSAILEKI